MKHKGNSYIIKKQLYKYIKRVGNVDETLCQMFSTFLITCTCICQMNFSSTLIVVILLQNISQHSDQVFSLFDMARCVLPS